MPAPLPLPLSQQVLSWLVLALGYENGAASPTQVSRGTLKNARAGNVIARSWTMLVGDVVRLLGLKPPKPEALHGLLRQWDAQVSSRRPPALNVRDALLPVLCLLVPHLGVRLGALTALVAQRTGNATKQHSWLLEPFDPRFFRRALDRVVLRVRPDLATRWKRFDRLLAEAVDERTLERWDAGDVPTPQNIERLIKVVGPSAEAPLRWARAATFFRREMATWVGVDAFASWCEALRRVASTTEAILSESRAVPRLAELYVDDLAQMTPAEAEAQFDAILQWCGVEPRADDTTSWLHRVAAARHGGRPPTAGEAQSVLALSVLSPHPRLLDAAMAHHGNRLSGALAQADLWRLIDEKWSFLALLRHLEAGTPFERELPNEARHVVQVPSEVSAAARTVLEGAARFTQNPETRGQSDAADAIVASYLFKADAATVEAELAAAQREAPIALLDRTVERSMPHDAVAAVPVLALARARRLAEAGDIEGAGGLLAVVNTSLHLLDSQARRDVAHTLIAIAHGSLDGLYAGGREWLALRDKLVEDSEALDAAALVLVAPIVTSLAQLDLMHAGALSHLGRMSDGEVVTEALVLSLPYLIRRRRLLDALGLEDASQPDAWAASEMVAARAHDEPNDGELAAIHALSLWWRGDLGKALTKADKRCEHLGTAALRDRWKARFDGDLPLSKVAGSGSSGGEA